MNQHIDPYIRFVQTAASAPNVTTYRQCFAKAERRTRELSRKASRGRLTDIEREELEAFKGKFQGTILSGKTTVEIRCERVLRIAAMKSAGRIVKRPDARHARVFAMVSRSPRTARRASSAASASSGDDGPSDPGDSDPPFPALRLILRRAHSSQELRNLADTAREAVAQVAMRLDRFDAPLSLAVDRLTALVEAA